MWVADAVLAIPTNAYQDGLNRKAPTPGRRGAGSYELIQEGGQAHAEHIQRTMGNLEAYQNLGDLTPDPVKSNASIRYEPECRARTPRRANRDGVADEYRRSNKGFRWWKRPLVEICEAALHHPYVDTLLPACTQHGSSSIPPGWPDQ